MEKTQAVVEEKWKLGSGAVVLSGRPTSCQGYVELINTSSETVEPRALAIAGLDFGVAQVRAPETARISARLAPHGRMRAPIEVALEPTTPPGNYTGQLRCGAQQEKLVIQVLESWDLRLLPQSVTVTAKPGEKFMLRTLIANLGNVELALPNSAQLPLEQKLDLGQSLNVALLAAGKQGFNQVLDRFAYALAEGAAGPATVSYGLEESRIRAGESRQVELEIRLPEEMKNGKVYTGRIRFKNALLRIEVECDDGVRMSPRRQK
ncbi:MAG TPA: hypothetical protein VGK44_01355 [Casimicrobiaceae bacterium]|jgi:hypothetical protein